MTTIALTLVAVAAIGITFVPTDARAQATIPVAERSTTVAAVRAVEDHWSRAELDGEIGYLDQLLLPEYRSVSPDGSVHPKKAILAGAERNAAHRATAQAAVDSFRAAHPWRTDVVLHGTTAVVSFVSLVPDSHEAIRGADILEFTDGAWHAIYSAHSSAR